MNVEIRQYNDGDFLQVKELIKEAFDISMVQANTDLNHIGIVACDSLKVVGYLLLTKVFDPIISRPYFLVDYVCVSSVYQRRNVGYSLMMKAEDIAVKNGAGYLQLTSSRFRVAAHRLYEKCGFKVRESDIFRKVL